MAWWAEGPGVGTEEAGGGGEERREWPAVIPVGVADGMVSIDEGNLERGAPSLPEEYLADLIRFDAPFLQLRRYRLPRSCEDHRVEHELVHPWCVVLTVLIFRALALCAELSSGRSCQ